MTIFYCQFWPLFYCLGTDHIENQLPTVPLLFHVYSLPWKHVYCAAAQQQPPCHNMEAAYFCYSALDTVPAHWAMQVKIMKCRFFVSFHRFTTVLNVAQQHNSPVCCTHFTAIVHNIHNCFFCFPVTPSHVHCFIWLKGRKHSYILSYHITSWSKVNYWSLTVLHLLKAFVTDVAYLF